eukprot:350413-Chlamydomonas_euryale.AAC.1
MVLLGNGGALCRHTTAVRGAAAKPQLPALLPKHRLQCCLKAAAHFPAAQAPLAMLLESRSSFSCCPSAACNAA